MPFTMPSYPILTPEQANPLLYGAQIGQSMMQKGMMFPQEMQAKMLENQLNQIKAKYAESLTQEELTKAKQANEWNPQIWKSEIGLRGAQTGLAGAETQKLHAMQPYIAQQAEADIAEKRALAGMHGEDARQKALFNSIIRNRFQPGSQMSPTGGTIGASITKQPVTQSQATPASMSSTYGIENPQMTNDDIINKMVFGQDTYSGKEKTFQDQVTKQSDAFNKELSQSVQASQSATKFQQALNIFNNAMNAATYKGPRLGNLASGGWKSTFVPGNLDPEQQADRAANQMLPEAISTLRDAMGSVRWSNMDNTMAQTLKFDRTLSDKTRQTMTGWTNAVMNRMQEYNKFLSVMNNPNTGLTAQQTKALFESYNENFPLISKNGEEVLTKNLNNWPLYTTPKAIESIKRTGTYKPSNKEQNSFMMRLPDGQVVPIKKGHVEDAFRKGATLP